VCEARRTFEEYRTCLRNELGVDPSPALAQLVLPGPHRVLRAVSPR
jgi:hypothetical protein